MPEILQIHGRPRVTAMNFEERIAIAARLGTKHGYPSHTPLCRTEFTVDTLSARRWGDQIRRARNKQQQVIIRIGKPFRSKQYSVLGMQSIAETHEISDVTFWLVDTNSGNEMNDRGKLQELLHI